MKFNPNVTEFPRYPQAELDRRKKVISESGGKVYDFGAGDPIEPTASFIRDALAQHVPVISQYPRVRGLPELRKTIAGYLERRFKVHLDPDLEILPTRGSKEAIYNFSFLVIDPQVRKKIVIMGLPGYPVQERSTIAAGGEFYPVELDARNNHLLDLESIPESVLENTAVCWLNYPHNPTGVAASLDYYRKQVELAKKYEIILCSDECYVDIFSGEPPPSILQIAKTGVLAFHSCSKRSGMTAYRSGFIAGDKEILQAYATFRETIGAASPVYTEHAAIAAWGDDRHARERNEIFTRKRNLFLDFFYRNKISYENTDATFYFWVACPDAMTGQEYAAKLLEKGLVVSPGEFFGGKNHHAIRVALVPSIEDCKEAIKIWEEFLHG